MGLFFTSQLEKNIKFKQTQRLERIAALPDYQEPLTDKERTLLDQPISGAVKLVQNGELSPQKLLKAYGKAALACHSKTNSLTEIMIKDAEKWAEDCDISGPLAGFPISLKDHYVVKGYDATAGFATYANKPWSEDGAIAKAIRAAGGYPYVKTNVPATMMSIEGYNDVWGRTVNPHNSAYAPGGSSQGEGALIASGGSRVGVGSDQGGSVRVPAAWSGTYSLKMTTFRFPLDGDVEPGNGFEGVQYSASPMARTIEDLRYFIEAIYSVKPWKYDYHANTIPWRSNVELPAKPKVGVLKLNYMLPLTPAQERALRLTREALAKQGCEIVEFNLPLSSNEYISNALALRLADGLRNTTHSLMRGEHNDPFVQKAKNYMRLPSFIRKTWQFFLRIFGYKGKAKIYERMHPSSVFEYYQHVTRREVLRREFHKTWNQLGIDFMITAVHPSPALPNYSPQSFLTNLFTQLFNLIDYPAGVVPVSRVDPSLDGLPPKFDISSLPEEGKISFRTYDAKKMAGLPTAVQVVGMRYEDEETLAAMELVKDSLVKNGTVYK